jgi:hypothetical protein
MTAHFNVGDLRQAMEGLDDQCRLMVELVEPHEDQSIGYVYHMGEGFLRIKIARDLAKVIRLDAAFKRPKPPDRCACGERDMQHVAKHGSVYVAGGRLRHTRSTCTPICMPPGYYLTRKR